MRVNIKGINKVKLNSDKFKKKLEKAVYGGMIKSALIDIETGAKKKLTQDLHVDTGRLRSSIHTTYQQAESFLPEEIKGVKNLPTAKTHVYKARSLGKKKKKKGRKNPFRNYQSELKVNRKKYNVFVGTDVVYARKIEFLDSYLYYAFKQAKAKLPRRIKREVNKVLRDMG